MAFSADMTVYEENRKESTWKLLELKSELKKSEFSKTTKSIVSFTISTKVEEKNFKYSFINNGKYQKNIKYFRINWTKYIQSL